MSIILTDQSGNQYWLAVGTGGALSTTPVSNTVPSYLASAPNGVIATDQSGLQYILSVNSADGSLITTPNLNTPNLPNGPGVGLVIADQAGDLYSLSVNGNTLQTESVQNLTPSAADNSIAITVLSLITGALRLLGVTASGELPSSDESNDALSAFQQLVDSWNSDSLTIFSIGSADYPLILNRQAFTLGPGGDFNTNRPARIVGMSTILLLNPSNPVEIPIAMYSWDEWQNKVPVKSVNGSFPQVCYDDGGMPLRTLNFWPIATLQQNNVRIYSWEPLIWPATLQTLLNFPPGYARTFRYNLAIEMAAEFSVPVPAEVAAIAASTLAAIKTMNAPELHLVSDLLPIRGGYNWRADMFGIGW